MAEGTHTIEYHLGKKFFVDMESADIRDADLTVHLDVDHRHDLYDLRFKIDGTVTILCDRCLDEMQWPIDAAYNITVKIGDRYNDDSDDVLEIPAADRYLNVSYMIYDTVSLAVPIKHVHPMGKCNRAMSALLKKHRASDDPVAEELMEEMDRMTDDSSAADDTPTDNVDPRWDALKKLTDNN